ncbi:glutamyl-tRNA reductase [Formivibrio citricus]|uniref:Glutamyl-tRNA reductase n=1 Tax=Formivibrio citricus TaxID=83765 RepID=A0A1I5DL77_9NEIS|nr:glutamyl-tRNA reductase [Formivibrio citricus]SFO00009.1 glutamyl-tRNA reductase [Formivibrio citricus]
MKLVVLGLNHRTAPLALRELLAFTPAELPEALLDLTALRGVYEAAIVSTCNRTELYCNTRDPELVRQWLEAARSRAGRDLADSLYCHEGDDAVRHVFRVAAGLDSMVLGEAQILGQVKEAERVAREAGTLGLLLNGLFQRAFAVAKEVRTETRIGSASVSMAAAAVRLAGRTFPDLSQARVLFVGAGEMIELCARHFHASQPRGMAIANRTHGRGDALAREFGAEAILLSDLNTRLAEFDVVVTSTASTLPIIGKGLVERALRARDRRPVFMLDLAVPRDIEAEVAELPEVHLHTVDDLAEVVRQGVEARQAEVEVAEAIIAERVDDFSHWLASRALAPTIRSLKDQADRIARHETARARKKLTAGDPAERVLEELAVQLANKFLHAPFAALNAAQEDEQEELVKLIRRLYRLHDQD